MCMCVSLCLHVSMSSSLSQRLSHHRGRDARGGWSIHRGDTADPGGGREPTSGDVRSGERLYINGNIVQYIITFSPK